MRIFYSEDETFIFLAISSFSPSITVLILAKNPVIFNNKTALRIQLYVHKAGTESIIIVFSI